MADLRIPSQPANHLLENQFPLPALHQPHGNIQQRVANPYVAGDDQQDVDREGVPQPIRNVVMQGQMQYPHQIEAPHYNAARHHLPPQPYPEVPYMHLQRAVGAAQGVPVHAYDFAPEVQGNHDGPLAQFPAVGPREAIPGLGPHQAPPANMPPPNGLRNLARHYLNNPDARVNLVFIEPGPGGRFEVLIALELANIF